MKTIKFAIPNGDSSTFISWCTHCHHAVTELYPSCIHLDTDAHATRLRCRIHCDYGEHKCTCCYSVATNDNSVQPHCFCAVTTDNSVWLCCYCNLKHPQHQCERAHCMPFFFFQENGHTGYKKRSTMTFPLIPWPTNVCAKTVWFPPCVCIIRMLPSCVEIQLLLLDLDLELKKIKKNLVLAKLRWEKARNEKKQKQMSFGLNHGFSGNERMAIMTTWSRKSPSRMCKVTQSTCRCSRKCSKVLARITPRTEGGT